MNTYGIAQHGHGCRSTVAGFQARAAACVACARCGRTAAVQEASAHPASKVVTAVLWLPVRVDVVWCVAGACHDELVRVHGSRGIGGRLLDMGGYLNPR
jgi:hypothetical protein